MKIISYLTFSILLFCLNLNTQANDTIQVFIKKIDSVCAALEDKSTVIEFSKRLGGRKVKMTGRFDNNTKSFKHKIKYTGGIKKEIFSVRYIRQSKPKFFIKVVLIDNEYFFVKYSTYKNENSNTRIAVEKFVDQKIYSKIYFNANPNKRIYIWELKSKK